MTVRRTLALRTMKAVRQRGVERCRDPATGLPYSLGNPVWRRQMPQIVMRDLVGDEKRRTFIIRATLEQPTTHVDVSPRRRERGEQPDPQNDRHQPHVLCPVRLKARGHSLHALRRPAGLLAMNVGRQLAIEPFTKLEIVLREASRRCRQRLRSTRGISFLCDSGVSAGATTPPSARPVPSPTSAVGVTSAYDERGCSAAIFPR